MSAIDPRVAWFADLLETASELGYAVVGVGDRSVTLVPTRFGKYLGGEIRVEGVFLNGRMLRELLRPLRRVQIENFDGPLP